MDCGYITIQSWMITELNLSGNDLITYAVIFGFSQDGQSKFSGSRQYIADWCNCSVRTVQNSLNNLLYKGLIEKSEKEVNGVKLCEYVAIFTPRENFSPHVKNFHYPSEKFSLNNTIISNTITNKEDNNVVSNDTTTPEVCYDGFEGHAYVDEFLKSGKKKSGKKNLYQKCVDEIEEYTDLEDLRAELKNYLSFRMGIKDKPIYNVNQWKAMLRKLDDAVAECMCEYVDVVKNTLDKGWLTFYPIKKSQSDTKTKFSEGSGLSFEQSADTAEERKEKLKQEGKRESF